MDLAIQTMQGQLQAQQQLLQQLQQAQQPVQAPAVVPFAVTPAQAQQDVVDLSTSAGLKLYKQIVTPLPTLFDGSPNKVMTFLAAVSVRAASSSWNANLLNVSNQDPTNPRDLNLVLQHCMLSLENVRAHAVTYVNQPTRVAQDAAWMYEFLRESLTESAHTRVAMQAEQYTVNGTPGTVLLT
jgi:hypothetical protein